jgi:orotidine-5'-phosphate decarboxylase
MKIIVALDYSCIEQAEKLIAKLDPNLWRLKVGITLFTQAGPKWLDSLHVKGFEVFLDLKFHDIPNQVKGACYQAASLGVWMLNVHALGGSDMMLAAKEGIDMVNQSSARRSKLIAVTILTSMNQDSLEQIGINKNINLQVENLANQAYECGLDGVVCSAHEVLMIKEKISNKFLCVTPGIRMPKDELHDQSRVLSPWDAIKAGSDFLVMGRSITQSENPNFILEKIQENIA